MLNQVAEDKVTLINPDKDEVPLTPDYYAVNTIYSVQQPTPSYANQSWLLPLQNYPTIGDSMTTAGISWKWYSGGYNDAMAGKADTSFQFHHQPFIYFENYAVGKPGRDHLKDYEDFLTDLKGEKLPQVSFYKPLGRYNMHPGYSIVGGESEKRLEEVITAIKQSKYWAKCAIFVTFDEHGGRWDHVAPPKVDRWGPGSRIPTILISPLVKKEYVDNTTRDSTSIMKFIQDRYGLEALGTRDKAQPGFENVFLAVPTGPLFPGMLFTLSD
jgi:acid phosphatase